VVDTDLRVEAWNERSDDLWGLRAKEVEGRAIGTLDLGLPVDELAADQGTTARSPVPCW
jgi:hypothetical protein